MRSYKVAIAGLAAALCIAGAARAEDCKPLARVTQVKFQREKDGGRILIPVTVNGVEKLMLFDTGGIGNSMTPATAEALKLPQRTSRIDIMDISGHSAVEGAGKDENRVTHVVTADTFSIGRLKLENLDFLLEQPGTVGGVEEKNGMSGVLGPELFKDYDIDIDYGNSTFSIMSADHCPGRVIYWPATAVAVLDAWLYDHWHLNVPVTVDGKQMNAVLDTGATDTIMFVQSAERELGINAGSADAPKTGVMHGSPGTFTYHHVFKSLSFDGIAVKNLDVYLVPDLVTERRKIGAASGSHLSNQDPRNFPDMYIGTDILQYLHLYIAYKEQKVYITAASAPPKAP